MIVAGVDFGALTVSVVLLDDNKVLSYAVLEAGENGAAAATRAIAEALEKLGLQEKDIAFTVSTGCGRGNVPSSQKQSTDVVCQVRGARWLFPEARTVLNLGAESTRAMQLNETGRVQAFVVNDKCAAGSGVFLEAMAKALQVPLEEMGKLALQAQIREEVSSRCVVFAESEVVSHIHSGVPREHIIAGLHKAVVDRILELAGRIVIKREVVATGGVARNVAIIKELEEVLGLPLLVPQEPQIVGALGAALIARDTVRG